MPELLAALDAFLQEHRYRQIDLAKRAKLTNVYLSQLENGRKRNPSVAVLQRLAKALRVPMTELLG
jgi:transcriptional regulator with XRE-family HTH domain